MNPTVVLADDQTCIRQMAAMLLPSEKMDVIGEARDGEEALALCRRLRPALLLTDLRLPKLNAVGVLQRLRAEKMPTAVMIYTGCEDDRMLAATIEAKPAALVHKADALEDFRVGVRCAVQGGSFVSPRPARAQGHQTATGTAALTPAELELLRLIASSKSNKMAADILGKSEHTISHRREDLMRKLDAHDVAELTRIAVRMGLVE